MLTDRYYDLDTCLSEYTEWYVYNQTRPQTVEDVVQFLKLAINGRLFILFHLKDEILALRDSRTNTSDLDKALDEFTTWYASNAETITDVWPLLAFLKKATDDSLHLLFLMRSELREAQNKQAQESVLWLPLSYR